MTKQKTLFLTGATGDIGNAIAAKFHHENFQVIAPTRQEMDLENNDSIDNFLKSFSAPLDAFIHCAGFNKPKKITDINLEDLNKTLHINSISFYKLSQHFIKTRQLKDHGHILGVSSIYGFLVRKGRFSYSASKFCLNGMIKTLALELGANNIKVNVIAPGFVDTKLTRQNNSEETIEGFKQKIPLGRLATPNDIADVSYFLCSDNNRYITGQEIIVDGGYSIGGFEQ